MTSRDGEMAEEKAYITRRIIDCCLRENLRGLVEQGRADEPDPAVLAAWPHAQPPLWWRVAHLPGGTIWIAAEPRTFMQRVGAASHGWLHQTDSGACYEEGAPRWLERIGAGLDPAAAALHRAYAHEADCAARHRRLAREGFDACRDRLAMALSHPDPHERALLCDQLASHRDHPFYPTARAKVGFDEASLRAYAPEFGPRFELHWLAVPQQAVTRTTPTPAFWPTMASLGLPAELQGSHALLPVHPATWLQLDDAALPEGCMRAPRRMLAVRPTLSVRTVVPIDHPREHIKLPLRMRTLGALNLRMIKPSTIHDGHWCERLLRHVTQIDPVLDVRCVHVDESHGAHVGEGGELAYILRRYPVLEGQTLVPVAALCAPMPDGRALALHLADRFDGGDVVHWWHAYASLLCEVHLRLWLDYGIALESNQQNAVLVYGANAVPSLLFKDNDAARIDLERLHRRLPALRSLGAPLDRRIPVASEEDLARMFCTITLQLCLLAVLEGLAGNDPLLRDALYRVLGAALESVLARLAAEGVDVAPARQMLDADRWAVKYLLSAGSLYDKQATGAADINKFYGISGPNVLRMVCGRDGKP